MMDISSKQVTAILNSAIHAMNKVTTKKTTVGDPSRVDDALMQLEMGVLVGITGQCRGKLLLKGTADMFAKFGAIMFGMQMEGEILASFAGELGNMVAGNMATDATEEGISIDITPPAVIMGQTRLHGFFAAINVPTRIEDVGDISMILILDEQIAQQ